MQSPVLVFDHVRKVAMEIPVGPKGAKKRAEIIEAQRSQVATSGRPSR